MAHCKWQHHHTDHATFSLLPEDNINISVIAQSFLKSAAFIDPTPTSAYVTSLPQKTWRYF